jgi:hypothetical protein
MRRLRRSRRRKRDVSQDGATPVLCGSRAPALLKLASHAEWEISQQIAVVPARVSHPARQRAGLQTS